MLDLVEQMKVINEDKVYEHLAWNEARKGYIMRIPKYEILLQTKIMCSSKKHGVRKEKETKWCKYYPNRIVTLGVESL